MQKIYLYGVGERIWHWLQAISIAILLYTGFEIHLLVPNGISFMELYDWHLYVGLFLILNTFIGNVYFLSNHKVAQFIPFLNMKFVDDFVTNLKYYLKGRFQGEHHPFKKTEKNKLNPLQKLTYFGMLFIVLPFQMGTGLLMGFSKSYLSGWVDTFGGFATVATAHVIGSFIFLAFLIVHIYLTFLTKPAFNSYRGIITGYELEEAKEEASV